MTATEIREELLDILECISPDTDVASLDDEKLFREQMELDSMDFLDIVMELRKRHRVQVPEDEYRNLASMQSAVAYLEPKMRELERCAQLGASPGLHERDVALARGWAFS